MLQSQLILFRGIYTSGNVLTICTVLDQLIAAEMQMREELLLPIEVRAAGKSDDIIMSPLKRKLNMRDMNYIPLICSESVSRKEHILH